jgi:hypothetical protein
MYRILKRRVEGFTVMEIMVTMVISSIVVLTAFEFYNIFNKLLLKKNNTMESGKEMLQFYNVLENDATKAISIELSTGSLIMKNYKEDPVRYEFYDDFVIRNRSIISDTFRIKIMNLNSIKDQVTGFDRILTMEMVSNIDTFPLFLEKSYTNDVLINSKILHKH